MKRKILTFFFIIFLKKNCCAALCLVHSLINKKCMFSLSKLPTHCCTLATLSANAKQPIYKIWENHIKNRVFNISLLNCIWELLLDSWHLSLCATPSRQQAYSYKETHTHTLVYLPMPPICLPPFTCSAFGGQRVSLSITKSRKNLCSNSNLWIFFFVATLKCSECSGKCKNNALKSLKYLRAVCLHH